jgi:CBS domain-containing protein
MQVKMWMTTGAVAVEAGAPLAAARARMAREGLDTLLVMADGRPIGRLAAADVRRVAPSAHPRLAPYESPDWADRLAVRDVMSPHAVWLTPTASLREAARLMATLGVASLPVVDAGSAIGTVSARDLLGLLASLLDQRPPAGIEHIVVGVERGPAGERAVATALDLARPDAASVTLVAVAAPRPRLAIETIPAVARAAVQAAWCDEARAAVLARVPAGDAPRVDVELVSGGRREAVLAAAARLGADLVVVGDPREARALAGRAACPVLLAGRPEGD